jgi:hypothetical protein
MNNVMILIWSTGLAFTIGATGASMLLQGRALRNPKKKGGELICWGIAFLILASVYFIIGLCYGLWGR